MKTSAWVNTTGTAIYIYNLEIWTAGEGVIRSKVVALRNKMVPEMVFTSSRWFGDIIHFANYYEIVPGDGLALDVTVSGNLEEAQVVILYSTERPAASPHRWSETSEVLLFDDTNYNKQGQNPFSMSFEEDILLLTRYIAELPRFRTQGPKRPA